MTDRPSFDESWYRVADLCPRLRSTVQTFRQQYRGKTWHILAEPTNNEFFRIDEAAYHFMGLLDGQRSVAQAWAMAQEHLGDAGPTQGEVIHLLGRLYVSNLIQADLSPDVAGMFNRLRKRRRKQIGGQLLNFMFVRLPLYDPDRFLDRWVKLFGWTFTKVGVVLWLILLLTAAFCLASRHGEVMEGAAGVLAPANLIWLSVCFWLIKVVHEFAHAFACKKFGLESGSGGEVHTMGLMLLALMPVPYVDTTSSWALPSKWHRMWVGAAGMFVELAVAAVAAIVYSVVTPGSLVAQLAYNVMFIAGLSTLLFNGNPLLRYDAYYMLSDYLEIPNLAQRSRGYLFFLIKRRVFGLKRIDDPTHSGSERRWFVPFAVASSIYRVFISIKIILFVSCQLFVIGLVMAAAALVGWLFVPVVRAVHYLTVNQEITRVRGRAVGISAATVVLVLGILALMPFPDGGRAEGIIEPRRVAVVHLETDGFVHQVMESGTWVSPDGPPLVVARNPQLEVERLQRLAEKRRLEIQRRVARLEDPGRVPSYTKWIDVIAHEILDALNQRVEALNVQAPLAGQWVSPLADRVQGAYVERGELLGVVASVDDLIVRVTADQNLGPRIEPEVGVGGKVEFRVRGRPDLFFGGRIRKILPAGQQRLPSAALGWDAGGAMATRMDQKGRTVESFFEVIVDPHDADPGDRVGERPLFPGQRVVVRFPMPSRPLLAQGWRALRQLIQRRFQI